MDGSALRLEYLEDSDLGVCTCCGNRSRLVRGMVYANEAGVAAYFVHWTVGHARENGAKLDLIIGKWGNGAEPGARDAVSLDYRLTDTGPSFRVIDAQNSIVSKSPLVGHILTRSDVIGTPKADMAFAVADAVLALDSRVAELLGDYRISFAN